MGVDNGLAKRAPHSAVASRAVIHALAGASGCAWGVRIRKRGHLNFAQRGLFNFAVTTQYHLLTSLSVCSILFSYRYPDAALNEKAECSVPSKPFRLPPLASDRSGAARGAPGEGRAGRADRRSLDAAVRSSAAGTLEGAAAKAGSRVAGKWCRKGLKRFNSRRELVWPGQPRSHNIWYWGERGMSSRKIPAASRRMAEATSDLRGAHVSAGRHKSTKVARHGA